MTDLNFKDLKVQNLGERGEYTNREKKTNKKGLGTLNVSDKKRSLWLWGDQERLHEVGGIGAEPN